MPKFSIKVLNATLLRPKKITAQEGTEAKDVAGRHAKDYHHKGCQKDNDG